MKMMKGSVSKIFFSAAVIKSYFYNTAGYSGVCEGQVSQPIMHIKSVTAACTAAAIALATAWFTIFCTT
jgi:hypothetical protein